MNWLPHILLLMAVVLRRISAIQQSQTPPTPLVVAVTNNGGDFQYILSQHDISVLKDLYDATDGVHWHWKTGMNAGAIWNFTVDEPQPCNPQSLWQGLTCLCSNSTLRNDIGYRCTIVELELPSYGLIGHIPSSLGDLQDLGLIDLTDNSLSGTVPASLGALNYLVQLELQQNKLSGSLADNIAENWTHIENLFLSGNKLSGTLPSSFSAMTSLIALQLNHNHFSGSLNNVFNSTAQTKLSVIQLSDNDFTGTLPSLLFSLPSLTIFNAATNCIEGPLPKSICGCNTLQTLLLNGLSSSAPCRQRLLGGIFPFSYILKSGLAGSLYHCLFYMPNLKVLQLSGNNITDQIPEHKGDTLLDSQLQELDLSHNQIGGVIPVAMQLHEKWVNLDLSHNKIVGDLHRNFTTAFKTNNESSLDLHVNRLSGRVPHSLRTVEHIEILDGNMFSCDLRGNDLPHHDKGSVSFYSCGSNAFNVPYYSWLVAVGLAGMVSIGGWYSVFRCGNDHRNNDRGKNSNKGVKSAGSGGGSGSNRSECKSSFSTFSHIHNAFTTDVVRAISAFHKVEETIKRRHDTLVKRTTEHSSVHYGIQRAVLKEGKEEEEVPVPLGNVAKFLHHMRFIRKVMAVCVSYEVLILVPIYITCTHFFGTYSEQYAWTVSSNYLSGVVCTAILAISFVVFILIFTIQFRQYVGSSSSIKKKKPPVLSALNEDSRRRNSATGKERQDERQDEEEEDYEDEDEDDNGVVAEGRPTSKKNVPTSFATTDIDIRRSARKGSFLSKRASLAAIWTEDVSLEDVASDFKLSIIHALGWLIIAAINMTVVVSANIGFVVLSLYGSKYKYGLLFAQLGLAVFKVVWNGAILRRLVRSILSVVDDLSKVYITRSIVSLEVCAAFFNNIVIPCAVVAAEDGQCFLDLLQKDESVKATLTYSDCTSFGINNSSSSNYNTVDAITCNGVSYVTISTVFNAPFNYSYQCSSGFTKFYAPAFVYYCLIIGLIIPSVHVLLFKLYAWQVDINRNTLDDNAQKYLKENDSRYFKHQQTVVAAAEEEDRVEPGSTSAHDDDDGTSTVTMYTANSERRGMHTGTGTVTCTAAGKHTSLLLSSLPITFRVLHAIVPPGAKVAVLLAKRIPPLSVCDKLSPADGPGLPTNNLLHGSNGTAAASAAASVVAAKDVENGISVGRHNSSQHGNNNIDASYKNSVNDKCAACGNDDAANKAVEPAVMDSVRSVKYFDATKVVVNLSTLVAGTLTFGIAFPPLGIAFGVTAFMYTAFTQVQVGYFIHVCSGGGIGDDRASVSVTVCDNSSSSSSRHNINAIPGQEHQLSSVRVNHGWLYIRALNMDCAPFHVYNRAWVWVYLVLCCWFYALILFDTAGDAVGFSQSWWILLVVGTLPLLFYAVNYTMLWLWRSERCGNSSDPLSSASFNSSIATDTEMNRGEPRALKSEGVELASLRMPVEVGKTRAAERTTTTTTTTASASASAAAAAADDDDVIKQNTASPLHYA